MSATTDPVDVPTEVRTAARRYWRLTLAGRGLLAVGYLGVCVAVLAAGPFVPALLGCVVVVASLRAPLFTSGGTIEAETDADPAAVRAAFAGPVPPVLAFQAALADEIRPTEAGAEFDLSSALGLASTTMETAVRARSPDQTAGGSGSNDDEFVLAVTVEGEPWGTYTVSIQETGEDRGTDETGRTRLRIQADADRRFGVRRLPDWLAARHCRDRLFAAQGYRLLDEQSSLSLR